MIAIFGQLLLYLLFLNSSLIIAAAFKNINKYNLPLVTSLNILSISAFVNLIYAYLTSDFSLLNVYLNSHSLKPIIYKIGGAWGNHEGSLLLMLVILTNYLWIFNRFFELKNCKKQMVSAINAIIISCITLYIIITSNPFTLNPDIVKNGMGLNPLLQDIGLLIHPPLLYAGYMGFALIYSIAIYALKFNDHSLLRIIRAFTIIPWSFLTLGIGFGGWWAYRELGWGGFWFWDPVENVSLMPWFIATSLLHILLIAIRKQILLSWSYLLAILSFVASILGAFLVRSGIVTSVHSFASDPSRGIIILSFMIILIIVSLRIFLKARFSNQNYYFDFLSREMGILLNNLILLTCCLILIIGTLYPVLLNFFNGQTITIGEDYYNQTIGGIFILLMIIAAIILSLAWERNKITRIFNANILIAIILSIIITGLIVSYYGPCNYLTAIGVAAALFLVITNLILIVRAKIKPIVFLAHAGVGILLLGAIISTNYEISLEKYVKKGEVIELGNRKIAFKKIEHNWGHNYFIRSAHFEILINNKKLFVLCPESRLYPIEQTVTADGDIKHLWYEDVYLSIGEIKDKEFLHLRIYIKPMINLVWLGLIMIVLSGLWLIKSKIKVDF